MNLNDMVSNEIYMMNMMHVEWLMTVDLLSLMICIYLIVISLRSAQITKDKGSNTWYVPCAQN